MNIIVNSAINPLLIMTFNHFLKNTHIQLTRADYSACMIAVRILEQSNDPTHDITHLNRMLDDLYAIIQNERASVLQKVDFSLLLLVICWHDAWKSQQNPQSIFHHFFCLLIEGNKSAEIFSKLTYNLEIDRVRRDTVTGILPKHGRFQLFPHASVEAKILLDLDLLELFSSERLLHMKQQMSTRKKSSITAFGAKVFYYVWIQSITEKTFYLQWSKQEFRKRHKPFIIELQGFMRSL